MRRPTSSRSAPAPYKFVDFKPGDIVRGEINTNYHMPNRPYFDTIEMKGGGDADLGGARRAADRRVRLRLEPAGRGRDPAAAWKRAARARSQIVAGRRHRAHPAQHHRSVERGRRRALQRQEPRTAFSDPEVRQAMALLCDKKSMQEYIYGRTGIATGNFVNNPPRFRSPNTKWEFNVDKANQMLDAAGWKRGGDGVREKDGKKMKFVYQTSINALAPEGAGDRQAGLPEGRHRPRAEVGHGVGVLLVRRRQPGHLSEVLLRHADVHDDHDRARRRALHGPVPVDGRSRRRRTSGRAATSPAGATPSTTSCTRPPRPSSIRSSAPAMFIKMNDMVVNSHIVIPLISRPRVRGGALNLVTALSGLGQRPLGAAALVSRRQRRLTHVRRAGPSR